jgi:hypothetical protein
MYGWAGLSTVYAYGARKVVDSYADPAVYQHAVYSVRGLSSGPHTLSIEVTHERDANTDGSWVWLDAFDIENGKGVPCGIAASAVASKKTIL